MAARQRPAGVPPWLARVATSIASPTGLVSEDVPTKLALGICTKAEEMEPGAVVQALEKCQGMALKLKAAKFLQKSGQDDIQALRRYAESLLTGGADHGQDEL